MDADDCLACEGKNQVNWLLTRLYPAATFRVCDHDIEQAMVALLATRMEVPAEWLTEVINAAVDKLNEELAAGDDAPAEQPEVLPEAASEPDEAEAVSVDG